MGGTGSIPPKRTSVCTLLLLFVLSTTDFLYIALLVVYYEWAWIVKYLFKNKKRQILKKKKQTKKTFYVHVALEFVTFLDLASSVIRSMLRTSHVVKNFTWKGLLKKKKNYYHQSYKKTNKVYFLEYSIGAHADAESLSARNCFCTLYILVFLHVNVYDRDAHYFPSYRLLK